ncbi:DUF7793 family protein [Pontimicrobium aquaticum]|uniref:DUF7793 domain-containing protein n=1 Tax=Pontimicrobium aquaticum TaxID=2565367 RepID=A0A4U0EZ55_9FLAO|nr:hypothetical protein [Pontimicrobium aquaticum]TJY37355.1 hypothetical protein E5167_05255 [Pontimicrobium aquaticum]
MRILEFPYGKIIILQKSIAEVIINEGVVMDEVMIDHYHDVLRFNLEAPFSLLVNKKHSYSYDFNAQKNLATINEIAAMAVVAYNKVTSMTTQMLDKLPRKEKWNLKIFSDREEALKWLIYEQEKRDKSIG